MDMLKNRFSSDNRTAGALNSKGLASDSGNNGGGSSDLPYVIAALGVVIGCAGFIYSRFKICRPEEYMIRTGLGIADMDISKKAIIWPFQTCNIIFNNLPTIINCATDN